MKEAKITKKKYGQTILKGIKKYHKKKIIQQCIKKMVNPSNIN